jgi:hypothetical protein
MVFVTTAWPLIATDRSIFAGVVLKNVRSMDATVLFVT